ncbi:MAG: DUF998 domain-containing protein [Candidatus Thorarchaeota archaeon]|jgi:hypothetical membrane protein
MSLKDKISSLPKPLLAGIIGPIIALVCIILAIAISPSFTWEGNALSDLGHYTRTDIGPNPLVRAIIFNSGMITAGVLTLYTTISFIRELNDTITRIGMLPFVSAALFLIGIGVFSENFGSIHFMVSVGFFLSFPWAMWIVGIGWLRYKNLRVFSLVSIILPFVSLYLWINAYGPAAFWSGVAIPEIVTALTAVLWVWLLILSMIRGELDHLITRE